MRIDPTGESLFLPPGQATPATVPRPPTAIGPPVAVAPAAPPVAVAPAPTFSGNVEAPPVFPDAGPIVAPSVPVATPVATSVVVSPVSTGYPVGQDHVRITPERLMAPVGTEVVLKAGVCAADGYFRIDRRIEWLLAREGAGQFVDLGDRDQHDLFRDWGDTPRKIDNWYSIGATSYAATVLQRGTPSPHDDIVVQKGEAWISLTSATEGTSHVTAYSPTVDNWQFRRAIATIYWVDAQWIFPPSAVVEAGRSHVLTTTVMRRTDGAPLVGWIVRYEVPPGSATLGYEGGNFVEVPTDSAGRASVEVAPSGSGGGSNTVTMTLFRPPMAGAGGSPQLEIGRGAATITWAAEGAIAMPAPPTPVPTQPGPGDVPALEPTPSVPEETPYTRPPAQPSPYTPPPDEAPAGRAQLDVRVTRVGPEQVEVDQLVRFDVTVTNRGDGIASGIVVTDRFDRGLRHPAAAPNIFEIDRPLDNLPPGRSTTLPLTFQVVAVGQHSHLVTVTADGGITAFDRGTVVGVAPQPQAQPVITVEKVAPARATVGTTADFMNVIKNTGTVPVTGLRIVDKYDPAFVPVSSSLDHERGPDGSIIWTVPRLEVGARLAIKVTCRSETASPSACSDLFVTADGGIQLSDQRCVEILPPLPGTNGQAAGTTGPLQASIVVTTNPVIAGQPATILVTVENRSQQAQQQVQLRVAFPPEMTIDSSRIQPQGEFIVVAQEVRFHRRDFQPGQRLEFTIPVTSTRPAQVRILARLEGAALPQAVESSSNVIEILSAAL